ncbi:hypothetical protein DV736_g1257, partial [Chaetothyriales sp. CBS 134916]
MEVGPEIPIYATFKFWATTSISAAILAVNYAPQLSLQHSYYYTAGTLFFAQWLIYSIYAWFIYPFYISPLRHLPTVRGGNFLFGQFFVMIREPSGIPMRRWVKEYPNEGVIRYFHLFNRERLLLTSPKAFSEVLTIKSYDFVKPKLLREGLGRVLGIGILFAEGDEHKHQRRNLMPAFSFRHIKQLYPLFWSKSIEMTTRISQYLASSPGPAPVAVEIGSWASRATLDIIGVAGMGQDFNSLAQPDSELNRAYQSLFAPSGQTVLIAALQFFIPGFILRRLPIKRNGDLANAAHVARSTSAQLIEQKRLAMQSEKSLPPDIISTALSSGIFTDRQLVDNMMTFLAAGHETTAAALTWCTYLLTLHPECQTRLRAEIHASIPDPTAPITHEIIDNMPYLHAVCNETLRFFAPVPLTIRDAAVDTSILGQPVRKGLKIIMVPWATNLDTNLWGPDADQFNPERWLAPGCAGSGGSSSNYAFLTFLHGPRSCIGQKFAVAEMACLVAALVGKFEIKIRDEDKNREIEVKTGVTARPKNGLFVNLKEVDW